MTVYGCRCGRKDMSAVVEDWWVTGRWSCVLREEASGCLQSKSEGRQASPRAFPQVARLTTIHMASCPLQFWG